MELTFPLLASALTNLINSCNILQRLTRSSHNLAASSFLVTPLLKFIAARSRWTFAIVTGLKWAATFARTNAFSSLFARLLQNASIKGELNSRARRDEELSLGKSFVINLSAFTSAPSQPVAHARCRKFDDKLGTFKYFPLVLADRTTTNEMVHRHPRWSPRHHVPRSHHPIFILATPKSWSSILRTVVLVKDFKIVPGFYSGRRDARRFVAVTEKESRQKVWEIVGIIWGTMSDIQGDSWRTSAAVEFCGNFLHVTDGILKIVWAEKVPSLLLYVAFI